MFFTVVLIGPPQGAQPATAYLVTDRWDDWFAFETMFSLVVLDEEGRRHDAGSVKIGEVGLRSRGRTFVDGIAERIPGFRYPGIPREFDALGETFFSLGQDETYYETLNSLSETLKQRILTGLRDVALNLDLFTQFQSENVAATSLLRSVRPRTVTGRFHRLAMGDARLTEFHFAYRLPTPGMEGEPPYLTFDVRPESQPPTNVHVLIGRNGAGKTRFMRGLSQALLGREAADGSVGEVAMDQDDWSNEGSFAGLVLISFSPFDDFILTAQREDPISFVQVGLRTSVETEAGPDIETRSPSDLAFDFVTSLEKSRSGLRAARWARAVETLESDDLFAEVDPRSLLALDEDDWKEQAAQFFRLLSSGHAIVLLTITRLVELVDERTLVLLDEPEAHLHPPLLSAFIRSLSDLLVTRNGVAIIATHSPVVLQEVPQSCTWKIRRSGVSTRVDRPEIETFGENVSVLTREVFGLEVTKSGFHRLVAEAVADRNRDYADVLARFDGQLGMEGKALAKALVAERDQEFGA